MPIDSSIYQGIKPLQFDSQSNNLANFLKLRDLQQSGQLNTLKLQEAQRGIEQQNNLRSILSGVNEKETPDAVAQRLLRGGFLKESSDYQKTNRENQKNEAATAKDMADVVTKRTEWYKNALNGVKTPQDAAGWIQAQYKDQYLAPLFGSLGSADDAIRSIPQDPAEFNTWISKQALNMGKFIELNKPSYHTQNLGNTSQIVATPGLGGAPNVVSSSAINQSPDSVASNARIAQEGALNRGVTMRGQNLQDARENLVPLETPTGYQAFSKKTGSAIPIMSGSQQLQQKDSPLVANQKLQGQLGAGIEEARKLIPLATASGAGALADTAMGFVGKSTKGGDAAQQLETLAGWMTSNVPRMQGPQSDKDVLLYKQMAAEVGNRNKPVSARMAALDTLEKLQTKYADVNGTVPPQNNMSPTKANAAAFDAAKEERYQTWLKSQGGAK